jgi:hypothetical protein
MICMSLRRIAAVVGLAVLMAVCTMFGPAAYAQSGAGSIQGTVVDAASAVIPNCAIDVVNSATGVVSHTVTNSTGFYVVPGLFPGAYKITFTASGMKKSQASMQLQGGQVITFNTQLQVGAIAEEVTVQANAIQLATYDSGTVSTQLDIHRIDQLPINGRNVLALASNTVPGVEANGTRANGMMAQAMEYTQDGAPMTDRQFGGETGSGGNSPVGNSMLPDPDTVQEVRFETNGSSAQFSTPATVELTTKSGTNVFHGSAFETARNNAIGIAKARQNPSNFAAPHYVRNEFGASVGGPIIIPKLYNGKDKSFFFFAYERFSLRQGISQPIVVPTDAERNGDFSGIVVNGLLQKIYDPSTSQYAGGTYTRTQYAYNGVANTINPALISPLAKALFAGLPHATNQAVIPQVAGATNYTETEPNEQTVPKFTFRLDHVFNDKNRAYVRFTHQTSSNFADGVPNIAVNKATDLLPYGISSLGSSPTTSISASAQYTHLFSPTFFAETVASEQWLKSYYGDQSFNSVNYSAKLGLPNNFGRLGFPGVTGQTSGYNGTQGIYGSNQTIINFDENLTKIAGKHQFQFGGRYRHERLGYLPTSTSTDAVSFSSTATSLNNPTSCAPPATSCAATANTGIADASFFIGNADSYGLAKPSPYGVYGGNSIAPYVQDNWHVSRSLTFNLGLRWEMNLAPSAKDDKIAFFDYKNDALVLPNPVSTYIANGSTTAAIINNLQNIGAKIETASQAGLPSKGTYNNLWNFNPRVGVAWTPGFLKHGTVIRGAFGSFIYPVPVRTGIQWYTTGVPWTAAYSQSYISAQYSPDGLVNYNGRTAQTVVAGQNSGNSIVNTNALNSILPGIGLTSLDPHYPAPHVDNYNVTIEQPLRDGSVIRASYVLSHGSNLDQNLQVNTAPSPYIWVATTGTLPLTGAASATGMNPYDKTTWGALTESVATGWSNNNSLQLNYQRPFKHGYAYQIYGVYSSAFRVGGNAFRDNLLYPKSAFLPGAIPVGVDPGTQLQPSKALNRFENYMPDTAIPRYRLTYNGVVDLPFGRGKHFLRNANRLVDELVGGFQVSFIGTMVSQSFQPVSGSQLCFSFGCFNLGNNYGASSPIKMYKDHKVTDCRTGTCRSSYLWFNGYISPTTISKVNGVPADYVADQAPINNNPAAGSLYGTNYVFETYPGGTTLQTYNPGPSTTPIAHTVLQGPKNAQADISLFKVFRITETTNLRFNVDAFNAFNIQGLNNPNVGDGVINFLTSYWTPRQLQLSGRFTF